MVETYNGINEHDIRATEKDLTQNCVQYQNHSEKTLLKIEQRQNQLVLMA